MSEEQLQPAPGRVPPNELDAEAAVLSAVLLEPEAFDRVQEILEAENFYADANRRIYEAIFDLKTTTGQPVDIVAVATWLRDRGRLHQVGGTPYLAQLADATPAVAHVENHARLIREKWRLRSFISMCQRASAEGYAGCEDVQEYLERYELEAAELTHGGRVNPVEIVGDVVSRETERLAAYRDTGQTTIGLQTGFYDLDQVMGGLFPGDLTIVAARPGMGKTAWLTSLMKNVAEHRPQGILPAAGLFFSMEMPKQQLAQRFLAYESGVSVTTLRTTVLKGEHWAPVLDASEKNRNQAIWVDDTPGLTVADVRAKVRRLKREIASGASRLPCSKLALVGIDYLQLMQGIRERGDSREQEVASLSRGLKALAKEEEVAVVALSQLNRALEKQQNKRPGLADLRESGAIEQDADNVLFIYRDNYYNREANKVQAEIDVAKQRNGPTTTVHLHYEAERMRFRNAAETYHDDEDGPYWEDR